MPLRHLFHQTRHLVIDNSDFFVLNENTKALIFVKSFTNKDLHLCREAQRLKIPIYVDLCDNFFCRVKSEIFTSENEKELLINAYKIFSEISEKAEKIITPGEELEKLLIKEFPTLKNKIVIIPDAIETEEDISFTNYFDSNRNDFKLSFSELLILGFFKVRFWKGLASFFYWRIRRSIKIGPIWRYRLPTGKDSQRETKKDAEIIESIKSESTKKILWFGNGGIPNLFGITDILLIKDTLIKVFQETPFKLIVCSNDSEIFKKYISSLPIDSIFVNWSSWINRELLDICDLVIIPNPQNDFTKGKSSNRSLLALSHRKPVIASETAASINLEPLIKIENWQENIHFLLTHTDEFHGLWEQKWPEILERYSSLNISIMWKKELEGLP